MKILGQLFYLDDEVLSLLRGEYPVDHDDEGFQSYIKGLLADLEFFGSGFFWMHIIVIQKAVQLFGAGPFSK